MSLPALTDLLKRLVEQNGSDLHITAGSPPRMRIHGEMEACADIPPLKAADTKQVAYGVLTDAQKHRFEEKLELDFSFGVKGLGRFRANLFNQRGAVGLVLRLIPWGATS